MNYQKNKIIIAEDVFFFVLKYESAGEKHLSEYEITVSSLPGLVPYYE
jgi:hypothetical protein